jgi:formylglycine-generating enzyme required for sulfatase activity
MTFLRALALSVSLTLSLALPSSVDAAELRVSDGEVVVEDGVAYVEVDVSWHLSWRNETNWDAAWLFVKLPRTKGGDHLLLAPSGHRTLRNRHPDQPDAAVTVPPDSLGAFVYRDAQTEARGPNDWRLRLRLALPGDRTPADLPETVKVYGTEMVYVPEGPFFTGDPTNDTGAFYEVPAEGAERTAYRVSSSDAIPVCSGPGSLCYSDADNPTISRRFGDRMGPVPASYPNGYDAFYLMKYELTQGQYADFLNALARLQTNERALQGGRNYYRRGRGTIDLVGDRYVATQPDRACAFLGWLDAAAYADWAGLRPMTELEYEKAARGPAGPVPDEFAWGTTTIAHGDTIFAADGAIAVEETGGEHVRGNANYRPTDRAWQDGYGAHFAGGDSGMGPLRVDIFETHAHRTGADSLRQASGAGYYGALSLSGSLFDRAVTATDSAGRRFRGTHGDGQLSYPGRATNDDWPGASGEGLSLRGGTYAFAPSALRVADRRFGSYAGFYRGIAMGFRAVRTAP